MQARGVNLVGAVLRRGAVLRGLGLTLAVLMTALVGSPMASAAHYEVEVCTANAAPLEGQDYAVGERGSPGGLFVQGCGVGAAETIREGLGVGGTVPPGGEKSWVLSAPAGSTIVELTVEKAITPHEIGRETQLSWFLLKGGGGVLDSFEDVGHFPPVKPEVITYPVRSQTVAGLVACTDVVHTTCSGRSEFAVSLRHITAVLDDEFAPAVDRLALPRVARGTVDVEYSVHDAGSGVARVIPILDGSRQSPIADDNGGLCAVPYRSLRPCKSIISSAFQLDTANLGEGEHTLALAVVDGTEQEAQTSTINFTVRNAPSPLTRPVITGGARVGGNLTVDAGVWQGVPNSFAFQWLSCPAGVRSEADAGLCLPLPGASGTSYAPGQADVGRRLIVQVIANNEKGSGAVVSVPSEIIDPRIQLGAKPPLISHVSLTRKRFRVVRTSSRRGRGSVLRFNSSKPGELSLQVERLRRHGTPKKFAKLVATIKAGRSEVLIEGKVGKKVLAPGRYQVTLVVRDRIGTLSKPVSVPFLILPG